MVKDLVGGYIDRGMKGTFSGKYEINSDGVLVGIMNDLSEDFMWGEDNKIILGVQNGHMNRMNFLKLSNISFGVPLMYTLENTNENNYQGFWVPLMRLNTDSFIDGCYNIPGIPNLSQAFEEKDPIKKIEILGNVKKSSIESFIMPQLIEQVVEIEGMKAAGQTIGGRRIDSQGGTGYLTLK